MAILTWLFMTHVGRYVLIGAAAVGLLFGARHHYLAAGAAAGQAQQRQQDTTNEVTEWKQEREQLISTIGSATALIDQANERLAAADDRDAKLVSALANLQSTRQTLTAVVASTPNSDLHAYTQTKLGIRAGAGYTDPEERKLAECVTQYPLCEQENQQQAEQLTLVHGEVTDLTLKSSLQAKQLTAWQQYAGDVENNFVALYNAQGLKRRSIKCLFLWNCARIILPLPTPIDVQKLKPQAN